jgi:hypothetical protein
MYWNFLQRYRGEAKQVADVVANQVAKQVADVVAKEVENIEVADYSR